MRRVVRSVGGRRPLRIAYWRRHRCAFLRPKESQYEICDRHLPGHCIIRRDRHGCTGWPGTGPAKAKVGGQHQPVADTHFTNDSAGADDFAAQAAIGRPKSRGVG